MKGCPKTILTNIKKRLKIGILMATNNFFNYLSVNGIKCKL